MMPRDEHYAAPLDVAGTFFAAMHHAIYAQPALIAQNAALQTLKAARVTEDMIASATGATADVITGFNKAFTDLSMEVLAVNFGSKAAKNILAMQAEFERNRSLHFGI